MSDLAGFLLARIAEDEAHARYVLTNDYSKYSAIWEEVWSGAVGTGDDVILTGDSTLSRHIARWDPARVLAECSAKQRIVEQVSDVAWVGSYAVRDAVLSLLALPYADHPDYDPGWQ